MGHIVGLVSEIRSCRKLISITIFSILLLPYLFFVPSCHSSQIFVSPYNFSLNSDTHQLHTTWEVKGSSITFICAFAKVSLMELSFTGDTRELSSGTSWAVNCEEGEQGDKMVIEVDVTKFRVQPFRSYKVCISLDDYITDSYLDEVCTHLFSFEKYVPYVPEEEVDDKAVEDVNTITKEIEDKTNDMNNNNFLDMNGEVNTENNDIVLEEEGRNNKEITDIVQDKTVNNSEDIESVLKHKLEDIDNFVRDDFKSQYLELKHEIIEEFDQKFIQSSCDRPNLYMGIFVIMIVSLLLHD